MAIQTDELTAVVYKHIIDNVPDGLQRETALWSWLAGEGKKKITGGTQIQFPIKLISNVAKGFIAGAGAVVDINPSVQLQYGVLNWKYYNFNSNFTLEEFTVAQGEEEVVDFIETKVQGSLEDSYRELSEAAWGSSSDAGKSLYFEGLKDILAASGTAYGGLTDTDYSVANAYLPYYDTTHSTMTFDAVNHLINELRARMKNFNKSKKIIGFMNPYLWTAFTTALQNQQRFGESESAKAGFGGFTVGNVEFYMDADCPGSQVPTSADNYLVLFPAEILRLYYKFGFGAKSPFDGKVNMPNQPLQSVQSYYSFNMVCNNRRLMVANKVLAN